MFRGTILFAVLFLVLAGTFSVAFRVHPAVADDASLEFNMVADRANYALGEQVNLTFVVTNISNETVSLDIAAWSFDFIVYNDSGFLYQWTRFRAMPFIIVSESLDPGQNITWVLTWPQTCNVTANSSQDFPVSAGTYNIIGKFRGSPYFMETAPLQVNISEPLVLMPSKNVIGQGYNLPLDVVIENVNDAPEDLNVTLCSNATTIGFETDMNVPKGTSTRRFNWNTSSSELGNYNLIVQAGNLSASNSVILTIPGDINGDFKVDLGDLVQLAIAYGSHSGQTGWNPNADINGNNAVDLSDLVILATHYSWHYP